MVMFKHLRSQILSHCLVFTHTGWNGGRSFKNKHVLVKGL